MEVKDSIDSAWLCILRDLFQYSTWNGESRDGGVSHELIGYHCVIDASNQQTFLVNPIRKLSPSYAAAETLWYLSGSDQVDMLLRYAPSYVKFADKDGKAYGAYGARIMEPLHRIIGILTDDPNSRQAVAVVWRPEDLGMVGKTADMPCTVSMQFLLRNQRLEMVVNMRSNDAWLGFPYDVFAFTCIQRLVASSLDADVGLYHHHAGSMHIYERNRELAVQACDWKRWKESDYASYKMGNRWDQSSTMSSAQYAVRLESLLASGEQFSSTYFDASGLMLQDLILACNSKLKRADLGPFTSGALSHAVSSVRP